MIKYDTSNKMDKDIWLSVDDNERIESVIQYHKKNKIKLPNIQLHSLVHVIIENQLAEGITVVQEKLDELISDGLSRHDALHAIGFALSEHLYNLLNGKSIVQDKNDDYYKSITKLTAKNWLNQT